MPAPHTPLPLEDSLAVDRLVDLVAAARPLERVTLTRRGGVPEVTRQRLDKPRQG
jgi:hypothetical protein